VPVRLSLIVPRWQREHHLSMNGTDDQIEITCEFLQKSIERAAYCTTATLPGDAFREILKLAIRQKAFAVLRLDHLLQKRHLHEVTLSGHELRSLLFLAIKAHPRERRHKLRVAVSSSRRQKDQ
jgi:hypothetical protein